MNILAIDAMRLWQKSTSLSQQKLQTFPGRG